MKKLAFSLILVCVLLLLGMPGSIVRSAAASPAPAHSLDAIQSHGPVSGGESGAGHHPYEPPRLLPGPQVTQLQTIPPVPGITFQIAGQQFVTGADGSTVVMVPQPGTYDLAVLTDTYHDPYLRVEFSRWLSESYQPTRQIHLPSTTPVVQVGLDTYAFVGEKFVGLDGLPIDPRRVTSLTIRSIQGDTFTFKDGQPRWIPASRITRRRAGGLDIVKLLYTVTDVTVDGSNVINKSQQQFYAQPNGTWSISLLFYSLRIQAADALLGFAQGKAVELQLPDGRTQTYPLDFTGAAQIYALARGSYSFRILGAKGLSTQAPIALSRDQTVITKVISYLDLGIVAAAGLLIALGLILWGRLSLRREAARNRSDEHIHLYET